MQTEQRVKAVIAYDGSPYLGFQKQTSTQRTVTHAIEEALHSLHIFSNIVASGRTDAGVHATGQVIHFDLPSYWTDLEKLHSSLNRKLTDITFKHISKVDQNFHARFSAKKRLYRYVFKSVSPSVFERKYMAHFTNFDARLLKEALACFEGEHDFSLFHKTGTQTHTNLRHIYKASYVMRENCHMIYFEANGFLRAQVRMMVNAAISCAKGEMSLQALKEQLEGTYKHTSRLAAPEGLYLAKIYY